MNLPSESVTREEVTIMVLTTIIEFACAFGLIGVLIYGWIDMANRTVRPAHLVALPLSFGLLLWTGYRAMLLICRPERSGFAALLAWTAAAVLPLLLMNSF